jgi:NNP family nitrate/nitrite transporter-like MFS transporter
MSELSTTTTKQGHWPTLIASFLHFDLSFMLWVLLGALGIYIAENAGLNAAQKGLMVAIPILSGSLLRVPLGLLGDRIGGKKVGTVMLAFLFLPLTLGWFAGNSLSSLLGVGFMLGTAGASFAVALPLASRWYPSDRQGLVMGIAAAGNSGTVLANLFAPRLANAIGWHNVLAAAMIPLALVLIAFALMAKDSPSHVKGQPLNKYLAALKRKDMWWFCLFYGVTFGGYVGLSSFLPLFWRDQYRVTPLTAGYLTALAAITGSLIRPVGGWLADKIGGARMLLVLFVCIFALYALESRLPELHWMALLIILTTLCLGLGNGAVFQLVPQRFHLEIGVATGVVGAVGGLGGFFLPMLLGNIKQATGSFSLGLLALSSISLSAVCLLGILTAIDEGWRFSWQQRTTELREALEEA